MLPKSKLKLNQHSAIFLLWFCLYNLSVIVLVSFRKQQKTLKDVRISYAWILFPPSLSKLCWDWNMVSLNSKETIYMSPRSKFSKSKYHPNATKKYLADESAANQVQFWKDLPREKIWMIGKVDVDLLVSFWGYVQSTSLFDTNP